MTSKNLFFNLLKEDTKRRAWVIALLALAMFFSMPIAVALMTGDYTWYSDDFMLQRDYMTRQIVQWMSEENGLIGFYMGAASILCGFSGFSYLNSKKKVDFYHSIPVKRGTLFAVYYVNGILMTLAAYAVNLLLALGMAAVNGAHMSAVFPAAAQGFVTHLTGFLILYSTVVVAVLLTGNLVIGFLGSMVFFGYGPMTALLVEGYFSTWFRTYGHFEEYTGTGWFKSMLSHGSPVSAYMDVAYQLSGSHADITVIFKTLAAVAVLTILSYVLYQKRQSEMAGKAMAFKKAGPVIKILLVIPGAMAGGLIFWEIQSRFGWAVFGTVCTVLIMHCLIEIIYHFDFKKLFANLPHMGICLAASLLILCVFKFDLLGYDTYKPKAGAVESAVIQLENVDTWVTYGKVEKRERDDQYYWAYANNQDYIFTNMKLTDTEAVLNIADYGIERNQWAKQTHQRYLADDGYIFSTVKVMYRLKNGRRVARKYEMPLSRVIGSVEELYKNPEYKNGVFPLLSQTPEETVAVNYQEQDNITRLELGAEYGNEDQIKELIDTYQDEFLNLSIETRKQESPVGMIQFMKPDHLKAVEYLKGKRLSSRYDMEQRCFYPVYPSFEKTITLLKQYGVEPGNQVTADEISEITIVDRGMQNLKDMEDESYSVEQTFDSLGRVEADVAIYKEADQVVQVFTDPEQIKAILPALIPRDYAEMNEFNQMDPYSNISVVVGYGSKKQTYDYKMDLDQVPEFIKQMFNYSKTREGVEYNWEH